MTLNNTSDGSMLHVTATSPSSSSSSFSSPPGFVFTNWKFGVRLTTPDVQDSYNLGKARWDVFHIAVLSKVEQG
jgi:hypothetical protein